MLFILFKKQYKDKEGKKKAGHLKLLWKQDWELTDLLTQFYKPGLCKSFSRKNGFRESVYMRYSM